MENVRPSRTLKEYAVITAKGFAMGASDVVPGVSGGTMAFILGIYEELIESIKNLLNPTAIRLLITLKLKAALDILPWKFLLAVGIGILTAIFTLARGLEWTLENHPVYLWSFFFGLVLASIFTVIRRVSQWNIKTVGGAIIGAILAYIIVGLVPAEMSHAPLYIFFSGVIAICAMILPGISGSFILVLLGQYEYILSAVNNRDFTTLFIFAMGAGIGLITFAQILSWLFNRYHDLTVAILIGLMAGSLRKIWPWKEILITSNRQGELAPTAQNILPAAWTSEVTFALILAIVGFALVFIIDRVASHRDQPGQQAELVKA